MIIETPKTPASGWTVGGCVKSACVSLKNAEAVEMTIGETTGLITEIDETIEADEVAMMIVIVAMTDSTVVMTADMVVDVEGQDRHPVAIPTAIEEAHLDVPEAELSEQNLVLFAKTLALEQPGWTSRTWDESTATLPTPTLTRSPTAKA